MARNAAIARMHHAQRQEYARLTTDPTPKPTTVARRFSIEATRPKPEEIEAVAARVPAGTEIYLTAVPTQTRDELVTAARNVRPYLIQSYPRDMGNGVIVMMREIDAPLRVFGRHWGGFRTAYRFEDSKA